jgi:hypothetical protein
MEAKLTRLTHKIAIQLHLVAESCTICSSHSRRPVRKLLDTHSYKSESASLCNILLNFEYIPDHILFKHFYVTFFPQIMRPPFTPMQKNWQGSCFLLESWSLPLWKLEEITYEGVSKSFWTGRLEREL